MFDIFKVWTEINQYQLVSKLLQLNDTCILSFLHPHLEKFKWIVWICLHPMNATILLLMWRLVSSSVRCHQKYGYTTHLQYTQLMGVDVMVTNTNITNLFSSLYAQGDVCRQNISETTRLQSHQRLGLGFLKRWLMSWIIFFFLKSRLAG